MAVVVISSTAEHVAIDDAGLVDINPAANFKVEFALGDRSHPKSLHDPRAGWISNTMANAGAWFLVFPEPARDTQ